MSWKKFCPTSTIVIAKYYSTERIASKMEITKKRQLQISLSSLVLALFISGCAGTVKNMQIVPPDRIVAEPEEGKSMVIFMRPSSFGFAVQSSVFEINENYPSLVGIVAAQAKVSYMVEPGEYLFMVIGESADFMSAELEANKTYFALVTPRMGAWKARFSLKPIHADELNTTQFQEWIDVTKWVEKSPDSDNWASNNMTSIKEKQIKYYAKWIQKDEEDRPELLPQDGQ